MNALAASPESAMPETFPPLAAEIRALRRRIVELERDLRLYKFGGSPGLVGMSLKERASRYTETIIRRAEASLKRRPECAAIRGRAFVRHMRFKLADLTAFVAAQRAAEYHSLNHYATAIVDNARSALSQALSLRLAAVRRERRRARRAAERAALSMLDFPPVAAQPASYRLPLS